MQGFDTAGKLGPSEVATDFAAPRRVRPERLAWPAAGLTILLVSVGMWFAIALLLRLLLG